MAKTPLGQFVWHEVMTTDVEAAKRFYSAVVGWTPAPWGEDGSYTVWMTETGPVGGCMGLPDELLGAGVPPHWLCYLGTPSVDDSVAKAKQLGGAVAKGPMDVPGAGRFAVMHDPAGAVFCLYTSAGPDQAAAGPPRLGEFSWHELGTTNVEGALAFYGSLVGWEKTGEFDMGPSGMYEMFGLGGTPMGGMFPKPPEAPIPYWLPYARVADLDAATERATSLGATPLVPPMEVPGGDRITVFTDPQGAVFALHAIKA
jgi:hypothetical protein